MNTTTPAYGMKWHNFLIYFSLWAAAILNVIIGFMSIAGGAPLYGIVVIGAAAYLIFARFQLANLKAKAYNHLLIAQLIVIAADLIAGAEFSSLASSIAACGINFYYYKKRESLFVN